MAYSSKTKDRAIEMRRHGFSYAEIQQEISVAKSLLSVWFKSLVLNEFEKENLEKRTMERMARGKINTLIAHRSKRIARHIGLQKEAGTLFLKYGKDPMFFAGIAFLWSNSDFAKKITFSTENFEKAIFVINWMKKFLHVRQENFYFSLVVPIGKEDASCVAWAKALGVNPESIRIHAYRRKQATKRPNHAGVMAVSCGGIRHVHMISAWKKHSIEYYGEAFMRPW